MTEEKKVWCEQCGSKGVNHKKGCPVLETEKKESIPEYTEIFMDDFSRVLEIVRQENKEKEFNPSVILDGESGLAFIEGEPMIIMGNEYVPEEEARVELQKRKVVREWLKLQTLINNKK